MSKELNLREATALEVLKAIIAVNGVSTTDNTMRDKQIKTALEYSDAFIKAIEVK